MERETKNIAILVVTIVIKVANLALNKELNDSDKRNKNIIPG